MATKNKHASYGRRACTEMPDSNGVCDAFDINQLPDDVNEGVN